MKNHKADCKCPPCMYKRAAAAPKETLSVRIQPGTKEKLRRLMQMYNRGAADIIGEAVEYLARRQGL